MSWWFYNCSMWQAIGLSCICHGRAAQPWCSGKLMSWWYINCSMWQAIGLSCTHGGVGRLGTHHIVQFISPQCSSMLKYCGCRGWVTAFIQWSSFSIHGLQDISIYWLSHSLPRRSVTGLWPGLGVQPGRQVACPLKSCAWGLFNCLLKVPAWGRHVSKISRQAFTYGMCNTSPSFRIYMPYIVGVCSDRASSLSGAHGCQGVQPW